MEKIYNNVSVKVNEEGYMTDFGQWTREIGTCIAREENIELTDAHWVVINYIQDQYQKKQALSIRGIKKCELFGIKEFYALFPDGPLKKATKIAGIPKPASCV